MTGSLLVIFFSACSMKRFSVQLTSASYLKFLMSSHNERDADFHCPSTREPAKRLNTY